MTELKSKPAQGYKKAEKKEAVPLSDVFYKTLRQWPWIILSVVICIVNMKYLFFVLSDPPKPDCHRNSLRHQLGKNVLIFHIK